MAWLYNKELMKYWRWVMFRKDATPKQIAKWCTKIIKLQEKEE